MCNYDRHQALKVFSHLRKLRRIVLITGRLGLRLNHEAAGLGLTADLALKPKLKSFLFVDNLNLNDG